MRSMVAVLWMVAALGVGGQPAAGQGALAPVADKDLPANRALLPDTSHFRVLRAQDYRPRLLFPAPPAPGSDEERRELDEMHRLIAATPKARIERAYRDGKAENPTAFSEALGHDLRDLPRTWALLVAIESEVDAVVEAAKLEFHRTRPYLTDRSMPTCMVVDPKKAPKAYPSGHAGFAYATAWALARLVPARAPTLLDRAEDYARSRHVCGAHYFSDTAASRPVAEVIADRLLADPALAQQVKAAREELVAAGLTG